MLTDLQKRCVELSYKLKLSHLSSVLNAVDTIDRVFASKRENEPFILSNGHAGLALYVVLEKYYKKDAEQLFIKHGTHPNRNLGDMTYCSSGSLGQAITVAVGMALADRGRTVHVMTSDGEMAEGSCWEALRIAGEQKLDNLEVICITNGYSAYGEVDKINLINRMQQFFTVTTVLMDQTVYPSWMHGYAGHYVKMDEKMYKELYEA